MLLFKLHENFENATSYVIPQIKLKDKTAETRITESYHDMSYNITFKILINLKFKELYKIYSIK
ncbi:hypothetical protein MXB_2910, partial [Myxobolus squamalis]